MDIILEIQIIYTSVYPVYFTSYEFFNLDKLFPKYSNWHYLCCSAIQIIN